MRAVYQEEKIREACSFQVVVAYDSVNINLPITKKLHQAARLPLRRPMQSTRTSMDAAFRRAFAGCGLGNQLVGSVSSTFKVPITVHLHLSCRLWTLHAKPSIIPHSLQAEVWSCRHQFDVRVSGLHP